MAGLDTLKPDPRNARKHTPRNIGMIEHSIQANGFGRSVLLANDGTIIAGNATIDAAASAGLDDVLIVETDGTQVIAVKRTDVSPGSEQFHRLALADNRAAELADWEPAILAQLNDEMDLSPFFFEDELTDLLATMSETEGLTDPDAVPEPPTEPTTKPGDLWRLGRHRLLCGDSTVVTDVERLMGGEKADMVFTDPPYGVDYEGINNDSRSGLEQLLYDAFSNYTIATKPGGAVYVFHSDRCADIFHHVVRQFCHVSSVNVWIKPALVLSQTDYQSRHEPCIYGWFKGGTHQWYGDRKQTTVWEYGKVTVEGHTTPKPTDLIGAALENSSRADDIVLDLFGGSGSTLIACEETGRQCRMMELDPAYCDVIIRRFEEFTGLHAELIRAE